MTYMLLFRPHRELTVRDTHGRIRTSCAAPCTKRLGHGCKRHKGLRGPRRGRSIATKQCIAQALCGEMVVVVVVVIDDDIRVCACVIRPHVFLSAKVQP